jgi:AAA family ATP:ADP antiporter
MLLSAAGFAALAAVPLLGTLVVFQVVRRTAEYALVRPAREVLFTVVTREEKYKAKNFIDTVVFRGGDVVGGWVMAAITILSATARLAGILAIPMALAAAAVGWRLGRKQEQFRQAQAVTLRHPGTWTSKSIPIVEA